MIIEVRRLNKCLFLRASEWINVYRVFTNVFPVFRNIYPVLTNVYPVFTNVYPVFTNVYPVFTNVYLVFTNVYPVFTVSGLDLGNLQEKIPDLTDPRTNETYVNGLVYSTKYRLYVWPKNTRGRGEVSFIEASTSGPGCEYHWMFVKISKSLIFVL